MFSTPETRALAQRVYDFILMNPEKHNQSTWVSACGTMACIAGTALFLNKQNDIGTPFSLARVILDDIDDSNSIEDVASTLLGLDEDESNNLFYCWNEKVAHDAVLAIAQGDEEKFNKILS